MPESRPHAPLARQPAKRLVLAFAFHACFATLSYGDADLASAVQLIERGQYTMAITRLGALIEKRPNSEAANEALFHLGRAYEGIDANAEALERYAEYLVRVPDGAYESEAIQAFRRLRAAHEEEFPSETDAAQQVDELRIAYGENPEDLEIGLTLATALWRIGRYDEAGDVLRALYERDPTIADHPEFRSRVEIGPDGDLALLTPEEQSRRDVEARPVAVFSTTSYLGGRDLITQQPRWYIVTGEVRNRSDRTVRDVQVRTTIYAFGNTIYDTDTQYLGDLKPRESRPFTARFTQFENINNISRYECVVSFE